MEKIKQWILNRRFVIQAFERKYNLQLESEKELVYQMAFSHAQKDLEETNVSMIDRKAGELTDKRLCSMLSPIDWNHVISIDKRNGFLYLGKERASEIQLSNLKAEAEFLTQSHIWKLLNETPKSLAHESMFTKSENLIDLQKGKSMLYHLDQQNQVINTLKAFTPRK